jgi:hypothetical protein
LRRLLRVTVATLIVSGSLPVLRAQDLAPRAYIITPVHWNAITLSDAFNDGNILLEGAAPVTGSSGKGHVPALSLYHALSVFGRSASVVASLPYGVMNFHGTVAGAEASAYRSGLLDAVFRFSVNLKGAPAMLPGEYVKWRQKTLLGFSFKVVAPTGQYDPTKLLNWGANRWAFRPELGLSRRWGHWVLDAYGGVVLHHQPRVLLAQCLCPGYPDSLARARRRLRNASELRRALTVLGLARRQLLDGRSNQPEWRGEPGDQAEELPRRRVGVSR